MAEYNAFEYLWPPRPANAQSPELLKMYERMGWVAQTKKNGTCNFIAISPEKELITMNRHNEPHKSWVPNRTLMAPFLSLPGKGWYVFIAELLHNKVTGGPRDTNYIFEVLVNDGDYLVGSTQAERNALLQELFPIASEDYEKYVVDEHTWIAKNQVATADRSFKAMFQETLSQPENEGIVLKNPNAKLQFCSRQAANSDWQVKCRKAHKNYNS